MGLPMPGPSCLRQDSRNQNTQALGSNYKPDLPRRNVLKCQPPKRTDRLLGRVGPVLFDLVGSVRFGRFGRFGRFCYTVQSTDSLSESCGVSQICARVGRGLSRRDRSMGQGPGPVRGGTDTPSRALRL